MLKANSDFRVVTHFGVSHLTNPDRSVAQFRSWQDIEKGTAGAMRWHSTFAGVPMTQDELNTYYPRLKEYTGLTKSKIGSGKVLFKDLREPLAVEYRGKVWLVAPYMPDTNVILLLPKSMTEPKITTAQRKYLDAHKKKDVAGYTRAVDLYQVGAEEAIQEAKQLQSQRRRIQISEVTSPERKPAYTVYILERQIQPVPTAPKRKLKAVTRKPTPARKPAPDTPSILAAPPELAADVLATTGLGRGEEAALHASERRGELRREADWQAEQKPKRKPKKKPAPKLTASQKEYLAIHGFVMVKRGGKYVKITR